jgi:hypothetical protein
MLLVIHVAIPAFYAGTQQLAQQHRVEYGYSNGVQNNANI